MNINILQFSESLIHFWYLNKCPDDKSLLLIVITVITEDL